MSYGNKYRGPAEKLSAARDCLMPPHPKGEAHSYAEAFNQCSLALLDLRPEDLDDIAHSWVATIERTGDPTDAEDPSGRGSWIVRAEQLSIEEKERFSRAVNELANWLQRRSYDEWRLALADDNEEGNAERWLEGEGQ